jgi:LCP family protein required for cell wall assembly
MIKRKSTPAWWMILLLSILFAGCLPTDPTPTPETSPSPSLTPSLTELPTLTPTLTSTRTRTPTATYDSARPWGNYAAPRQTAITRVPPPLSGVSRPSEVQAIVLLGTDRSAPFVSRTDAIQIILYHPRLARASLISLPPDLMVYIPGYTMQRLQVAYAIGGWRGLADTLQYNFGIRPNHYIFVHVDEFVQFIDKYLKGLDVTIYHPYLDPKLCGGIPTGTFHMTGEQVLCYIRFRLGGDEADRNQRQQEIFRLILMRMVQSGNLTLLPDYYQAFRQTLETDLTLPDLLEAIPLVLKLGTPNRMAYYYFGEEELSPWKIPGDLSPQVFLPVREAMLPILQNAMGFIQTPAPLSEVIKTYEFAMTIIPTATASRTPTITPTFTLTPRPGTTQPTSQTRSATPSPSSTVGGPTPTPTLTPTLTKTSVNTAYP